MGLRAEYPGVQAIEKADYLLTYGIAPGVIHLEMLPQAGVIPITGDVTLSDGTNTLLLKECRAVEAPARSSAAGRTWNLTLMDRRWRWRFGKISGRYNAVAPGKVVPDETGKKSARDLGKLLLDAMNCAGGYEHSALPNDDYPEVVWDYANPASELSALADLYGIAIAYDPESDKVTLKALGEGQDLPRDLPYESWEITVPATDKPKRLVATADKDEYDGPLELEAVGMDTDGSVKPLADLSYKPAAWADIPEFLNLTAAQHAVADDTVFRWYRLKASVSVQGLGTKKREECLPWYPRRCVKVSEVDGDGKLITRNAPMFVDTKTNGVRDPDSTGRTNMTRAYYDVSFSTDDERGIVMFSRPVYKWDGVSMVGADVRLWATIQGERYERARDMGGPEGDRYEFVAGICRQFIAGTQWNTEDVNKALDLVLDAQEKQYKTPTNSGSANYIGLVRKAMDGAIRSLNYAVGKAGATTVICWNTDQSYKADIVRRKTEAEARLKRKLEQYENQLDAQLQARRRKE